MLRWDEAIAETRRRFEPRRLAAWGRWGVAAPNFERAEGDRLLATYEHHPRLFREGRVEWAAFVMANRNIFEPGEHPCAALVVHGPGDESLDADPSPLLDVADDCYALRDGELPDEPADREFALLIRDDYARLLQRPVPAIVAGDDGLVVQSLVIHREHIPGGVLRAGRVVPLLVHPATAAALVLPHEYWAPALLRAWERP